MISFNKPIFFLLLLLPIVAISQEKFTLSGIITDQSNNETLIGANIIIPSLNTF